LWPRRTTNWLQSLQPSDTIEPPPPLLSLQHPPEPDSVTCSTTFLRTAGND